MFSFATPGIPSFGDLAWHSPVRLATIVALPAATYNGGPPATLTANVNGALPTIDGVAPAVGDRLLVRAEATTARNGIYTVTGLGSAGSKWVLTRASDADTTAELPRGSTVFALEGTANGSTYFVLITAMVTLGTSGQTWSVIGVNANVRSVAFFASATYTAPTDPSFYGARIRAHGGGGGGGGAGASGAAANAKGAGGGAGGYAESFIGYVQLGVSQVVTIGAGGPGGVGGAGGTAGGATSFGALVIANGGPGGGTLASSAAAFSALVGPAGGSSTGEVGDYIFDGQPGIGGVGGAGAGYGGNGGSGIYGGGGQGRAANAAAALAGIAAAISSGSGGGGAVSTAGSGAAYGGAGAAGFVLVDEYYSS